MHAEQNDVKAWHKVMGQPAAAEPTLIPHERLLLRYRLIEEELEEYRDAALDGDLTGVADALADLTYVILGAAVEHGMDLRPFFWAVAKSNWSKLDENNQPVPHPTIPNKIGKSDRYQTPTEDIQAELEAQGAWL